MFDTILDLPVHALVVHAVVVLVPLAALGAVLLVVRPRLRSTGVGWSVVGLAILCVPLAYTARESGLKLKERLNAGGEVARQIADHESFGKVTVWYVLVLAVFVTALVLSARRDASRRVLGVLAVLVLVSAGAATVQVALTGHSGSVAVWRCIVVPAECSG